jgi:soluble lytic murein transglycosylase-like protein
MDITTAFFLVTLQFHLPQGLLSSLCYVESKHNPIAVHIDDGDGNSLGICQVKWSTARWLGFKGTEQDLMDPSTNIYYAGKYLAKQLQRYPNEINKAVIAYNQGHANLTTTKYQVRVFNTWEEWRKHGVHKCPATRDKHPGFCG